MMPNAIATEGYREANSGELRRCLASGFLSKASGIRPLRRLCLWAAFALEGGMAYSLTARVIMLKRYGVTIGAFSYGGCFAPGAVPSGVVIGRYVSMASGIRIFRRDRYLDWLSLHPFFFNPIFGFVAEDPIPSEPLAIEDDAWVGDRVIITPGCKRIGLGSVVGAGAVVTKDVPDFAVFAGNPARLIKYRFPEQICSLVRRSRWWLQPQGELTSRLPEMTHPVKNDAWLKALEEMANVRQK
jgi:virginiamycin A acetyltransferase